MKQSKKTRRNKSVTTSASCTTKSINFITISFFYKELAKVCRTFSHASLIDDNETTYIINTSNYILLLYQPLVTFHLIV